MLLGISLDKTAIWAYHFLDSSSLLNKLNNLLRNSFKYFFRLLAKKCSLNVSSQIRDNKLEML